MGGQTSMIYVLYCVPQLKLIAKLSDLNDVRKCSPHEGRVLTVPLPRGLQMAPLLLLPCGDTAAKHLYRNRKQTLTKSQTC